MTYCPRRTASVTRQVILVTLLLVVGAAFAYDKLVATPQWKAAWDKIKEIDASNLSGATTSEDIHQLMGRQPAFTDDSRDDVIIEKFVWRGGLLINSHDIYVVYSKPKVKRQGSSKLFYYSASAGQQPNEDNFPVKVAVHMNLNPSPLLGAGGPAPPGGGGGIAAADSDEPRRRQRPSDDDSDAGDKTSDDKKDKAGAEKGGEAKKDEAKKDEAKSSDSAESKKEEKKQDKKGDKDDDADSAQ